MTRVITARAERARRGGQLLDVSPLLIPPSLLYMNRAVLRLPNFLGNSVTLLLHACHLSRHSACWAFWDKNVTYPMRPLFIHSVQWAQAQWGIIIKTHRLNLEVSVGLSKMSQVRLQHRTKQCLLTEGYQWDISRFNGLVSIQTVPTTPQHHQVRIQPLSKNLLWVKSNKVYDMKFFFHFRFLLFFLKLSNES